MKRRSLFYLANLARTQTRCLKIFGLLAKHLDVRSFYFSVLLQIKSLGYILGGLSV